MGHEPCDDHGVRTCGCVGRAVWGCWLVWLSVQGYFAGFAVLLT